MLLAHSLADVPRLHAAATCLLADIGIHSLETETTS